MQLRGGQLERGSAMGGYRIDELISRGGMGVVYRVTNLALNRIYALKVIAPELAQDEEFRERFKREMRIAASIRHPNVVAIHYAGEHERHLFFVMDFVLGTDLREILRNEGPIEPDRSVELLTQFAAALDAAHALGLVHRDVKPANILITIRDGEEHAYLTDFGVAKRFDSIAGLTAHGAVVGTVDYMPPEQISGRPADARTDIYALGCVFFQMLTGAVPYDRENSVAKLFAHVHDPPPPLEGDLADLHPMFSAVLDKALAKDPADRYSSAGDLARDAAEALRGRRYSGPATVVATGEAKPCDVGPGTVPSIPESVLVSDASAGPPDVSVPGGGRLTAGQPPPLTPPAPSSAASPALAASRGGIEDAVEPPTLDAPAHPGHAFGRYWWMAVALLVLIGGGVAAVLASSSGGSRTAPRGGQRFVSSAPPVPFNRVSGRGTASVQLRGNVATVALQTSGLLNGSPHLMHIHAGGQGICPPATAARLHNGHRSISTTDGLKYYGPPVVSLTTRGDTSASSNLDFERYPAVGNIRYRRTMTVTASAAAAIRAGNAVIVVHGIDYNGNGVYDNILDRSELSPALPGEATAPALCGPLFNSQSVAETTGRGSASAVYAAALGTTQ